MSQNSSHLVSASDSQTTVRRLLLHSGAEFRLQTQRLQPHRLKVRENVLSPCQAPSLTDESEARHILSRASDSRAEKSEDSLHTSSRAQTHMTDAQKTLFTKPEDIVHHLVHELQTHSTVGQDSSHLVQSSRLTDLTVRRLVHDLVRASDSQTEGQKTRSSPGPELQTHRLAAQKTPSHWSRRFRRTRLKLKKTSFTPGPALSSQTARSEDSFTPGELQTHRLNANRKTRHTVSRASDSQTVSSEDSFTLIQSFRLTDCKSFGSRLKVKTRPTVRLNQTEAQKTRSTWSELQTHRLKLRRLVHTWSRLQTHRLKVEAPSPVELSSQLKVKTSTCQLQTHRLKLRRLVHTWSRASDSQTEAQKTRFTPGPELSDSQTEAQKTPRSQATGPELQKTLHTWSQSSDPVQLRGLVHTWSRASDSQTQEAQTHRLKGRETPSTPGSRSFSSHTEGQQTRSHLSDAQTHELKSEDSFTTSLRAHDSQDAQKISFTLSRLQTSQTDALKTRHTPGQSFRPQIHEAQKNSFTTASRERQRSRLKASEELCSHLVQSFRLTRLTSETRHLSELQTHRLSSEVSSLPGPELHELHRLKLQKTRSHLRPELDASDYKVRNDSLHILVQSFRPQTAAQKTVLHTWSRASDVTDCSSEDSFTTWSELQTHRLKSEDSFTLVQRFSSTD
ncbi:unnamed protein product [Pleuronectes platessa]|uniref:Uncharacterized protein n=1 Tax=Pleuronectes platessa TaxID=8262 RepID=A0A9N7TJB8_PLEPL|nr:unnamed protein product [Pleuronectes platessa]